MSQAALTDTPDQLPTRSGARQRKRRKQKMLARVSIESLRHNHLGASWRRLEYTMIELTINGEAHRVDTELDMPLLWYLRDELGLTGTRFGCGAGLCGCCTVHVNNEAMRSCSITLGDLNKASVITIEHLSANGLHVLQQAWIDLQVPQCGYCQSGQIMQAAALLSENPKPSDADIDAAMSGNVCRCGTYPRIRAAIKLAAYGGTSPKARAEEK